MPVLKGPIRIKDGDTTQLVARMKEEGIVFGMPFSADKFKSTKNACIVGGETVAEEAKRTKGAV
jgi:hypothetical protein